MKLNFLFNVWPYIAVGLSFAGVLLRYLLLRRNNAALRAEMLQAWVTFAGGRIWRLSLFLLLAVHLIGAASPLSILLWDGDARRLYLLESTGFLLGLSALVAGIVLVWRHVLRHGEQKLAEVGDSVFLTLFFLAITSGLLMAILHRWGSVWGALTLSPYAASLLRGRPAADFAAQLPFLVRLHVTSAFAAMAALPLSRLSAFLVAGLQLLMGWADQILSAAGESGRAWVRKHSPASWLWPEED